jgi:hypothetical protein
MMTFEQSSPPSPHQKRYFLTAMTLPVESHIDFEVHIQPETPLERYLLSLPEFKTGYNWGKPRFGHPEGKVGFHVREVLDNIDGLAVDAVTRVQLRLIALCHDTFKYQEELSKQQGPYQHHSVLARRFVEPWLDHPHLLNLIELHDEAFYSWRTFELEKNALAASARLESLLQRIGDQLLLYFLFFKCDTQTGDKIQAPLYWFEQIVRRKLQS